MNSDDLRSPVPTDAPDQPDYTLEIIRIGSIETLPAGQRKLAFYGDRSYVVFNLDNRLHAIENSCPHNGASLASGKLEHGVLYCPAHGLGFDLTTGCMHGTAGLSLKRVAVQVRGGMVELLPDAEIN